MRTLAHLRLRAAPALILAPALTGCLVVKTEVDWRGAADATSRPPRPAAAVELRRRPHLATLPFVFVSYATRGYGLAFSFSTPRAYATLDSVRYRLYNRHDSLLLAGTCRTAARFYRPAGANSPKPGPANPAGRLRFAACQTPHTLALPIRADSVVRLDFQAFLTDSAGRPQRWSYDNYRLLRHGRRVGSSF
ncbi:hypothetical protein EJV47_17915 [Hymenobacter gummosus]|uniref:Lipoprotein n=1 Tax=Hymenobacter gummosus TaxID=1776032 RepID=A0A3S0J8C6_9BACT|nr:hypothetical protein [Hymenobacter gummosus]RTQ47798.1 hypothetical protein EJV47_17915 [Hymenobacter gummosus]